MKGIPAQIRTIVFFLVDMNWPHMTKQSPPPSLPSLPPPPPYLPARGCDEELTQFCNQHCPHATEHGPLLARLDMHGEHGAAARGAPSATAEVAWRCYSRSTLDDEELNYVSGKAYCTRHFALEQQLDECIRKRGQQSHEPSGRQPALPATASVDARGRSQPLGRISSSALPHGVPHSGASGAFASELPPDGPPEGRRLESVEIGRSGRPGSGSVGVGVGVGTGSGAGASRAAGGAADPSRGTPRPRIGLVVARCDEQLAWLAEVQRGLREGAVGSQSAVGGLHPPLLELHVYERCGSRDEDAWPRLLWHRERRVYLVERGEVCYAYLHYLRDMYRLLPDAILFLHGRGPQPLLPSVAHAAAASEAQPPPPAVYQEMRTLSRLLYHDRRWANLFRNVANGARCVRARAPPACHARAWSPPRTLQQRTAHIATLMPVAPDGP